MDKNSLQSNGDESVLNLNGDPVSHLWDRALCLEMVVFKKKATQK